MSQVRLIFRMSLFGLALIAYFVSAFFILMFCGFNFDRARPHLTKIISITSRVGLSIFKIRIKKNCKILDHDKNHLIVSNHLTYLDVLIISSIFPACFVTSVEMKQTPFLGQLCLLGGCLFVERRSKRGLGEEVAELTKALGQGLNVVIFPEATSTNGENIIKFKRPLFQAAINSNKAVLPICLNYRFLGDNKVSLKNRDHIFWYDSTPFFIHALKLFSYSSIEAEISVLNEIYPKDFTDKIDLAEKSYEIMKHEYIQIIK